MLSFGLGHGVIEQERLHVDLALVICHLVLQVVSLSHWTGVD